MRRALPLLLLFAFVAEDARASCAPPVPRQQLRYADAAFVGSFVSSRSDGRSTWYRFAVERSLKGELGETVEVYQRGVSTLYFEGFRPGERQGQTMNRENGVWLSNNCHRYDPEELIDAFKPIGRPLGRGRAAYYVSGAFGNAGGVLLDRRGRTLAYSFSGGGPVSVCPGGWRLVQLSSRIRIRRTRDLRVVDSRRAGHTRHVHCLGRVIVRATSTGLFRGTRRIWRGAPTGIDFHRGAAFVSRERELVRVDLVTGRERMVATLPAVPTSALAVSPDGRHAAMLSGAKLMVAVLRTGEVRALDMPEGAAWNGAVWTARDRFAIGSYRFYRSSEARRPARFFDTELGGRGEVPGWTAWPAVGRGGAMIGVVGHRVEAGTTDGVSELGRLPGSLVTSIHRLPAVPVDAPRRVPRY